jgi:L-aminopeptidase/D-esterase-like protein
MALGIEGVRVGVATTPGGRSGCTVVLPPPDTLGAVAVRGASPGTREAAALGAMGKLTVCHGVVLAGGSAFGLATADGVMTWLEKAGIGYPIMDGIVPIVGAAIVLDRTAIDPAARPGAATGIAACEAAGAPDADAEVPEGAVGVGTGCTVAKVGGLEHAWRSGQGVAVRSAGGVTVGVVVANNAVGEVIGDDGRWIARARIDAEADRYPIAAHPGRPAPGGSDQDLEGPSGNTVIGCIVTDARLTKRDAVRVADLAHDGVARAIRPAHTELDGDALFCLATGRVDASVDLVAHLAVEAVAEATRRGPLHAAGRDGLPGLADG